MFFAVQTLTIGFKNCMMCNVVPLRGVAQLGRALRSGRRGRVFESRHPDFFILLCHVAGTALNHFDSLVICIYVILNVFWRRLNECTCN